MGCVTVLMINDTSSIFTAAANKEHKFLGVIVPDPCNIFFYLASCYNVNFHLYLYSTSSLHELLLETCCRHAYDIIVPPCRLSLTRDSFVPATVREWNSINISVHNLDSSSQFKRQFAVQSQCQFRDTILMILEN